MNQRGRIDLDHPDTSCEQCGYPKPRLIVDDLSRLLLCEPCLDQVKAQQAWALLREADRV